MVLIKRYYAANKQANGSQRRGGHKSKKRGIVGLIFILFGCIKFSELFLQCKFCRNVQYYTSVVCVLQQIPPNPWLVQLVQTPSTLSVHHHTTSFQTKNTTPLCFLSVFYLLLFFLLPHIFM